MVIKKKVKRNPGSRMVLTLRPTFFFTSRSLVWFYLLATAKMLREMFRYLADYRHVFTLSAANKLTSMTK
jgi:hypothetical protein